MNDEKKVELSVFPSCSRFEVCQGKKILPCPWSRCPIRWKKDFEDSFSSKLDILADDLTLWLISSIGYARVPSSIFVRKMIEGWNKKEILGESE